MAQPPERRATPTELLRVAQTIEEIIAATKPVDSGNIIIDIDDLPGNIRHLVNDHVLALLRLSYQSNGWVTVRFRQLPTAQQPYAIEVVRGQ